VDHRLLTDETRDVRIAPTFFIPLSGCLANTHSEQKRFEENEPFITFSRGASRQGRTRPADFHNDARAQPFGLAPSPLQRYSRKQKRSVSLDAASLKLLASSRCDYVASNKQ
jgi:hypothetical protein